MNVEEMVIKHGLKPTGVIQVGSHHGEEIHVWERLRIPHVHFEPVRANYVKMMNDHPNARIYPVALGSIRGVETMHCETINGGQSCSLCEPGTHLDILPWIKFDYKEDVIVMRLDDFRLEKPYNFLYVDAQGFEMSVFRGASSTMQHIDAIICEVNKEEVFKGCPNVDKLDSFLETSWGFKRVETDWHGGVFGDALFTRK